MKKSKILSSAFVMTMVSFGAFGADEIITGGPNTCTVDVLGVSDNNATAKTIATWTPVIYECAPGQYLLETETSVECTPCPTGSYCPGGTYTVESENTGATACPTDYTSDAGSAAESECYIGCELACSKNVECPAHSNNCTHSEFKTTGKQFSGGTCNAYPSVCPVADFQCDMGYSMQTITYADIIQEISGVLERVGALIDNLSLVRGCDLSGQDVTVNDFDNGINDCDFVKPGTLLFDNRYLFEFSANSYDTNTPGILVGNEYLEDDLIATRPYYLLNADFQTTDTGDYGWVKISQMLTDTADTKLLEYAFNNLNTAGPELLMQLKNDLKPENYQKVIEFYTKVQSGVFSSMEEAQSEFYKILSSTREMRNLNSVWVSILSLKFNMLFAFGYGLEAMRNIDIDLETKYCTPNMINIRWNPDNGGVHVQNMCLYDGAIALPSDPVKPGYTFTGWKLVE